jgi:hypothetical protein
MKLKIGLFAVLLALAMVGCATAPVAAQSQVLLEVKNATNYYTQIYVDGIYVGTLDPLTKDTIRVPFGSHVLKAYATGTDLIWGPTDIYDDDIYIWTLTED